MQVTMAPGLAVLDTWLMMLMATALLWVGTANLYSKSGGADGAITLLGGVVSFALVALFARRGRELQRAAWALRITIICCLAYFAWFQQHPWFALDDSALVRGSFRQEFFLQRLEQLGAFLLFTVPIIALGIWRGKTLPAVASPSAPSRANSAVVWGLAGLVLALVLAVRIAGPPKLGPLAWTLGGVIIAALLVELARRVNRAEIPAVYAFGLVVVMTPVLLLWQ
jgi:hypothetical protein